MLYGGSGPKGGNTDPRSGRARQESMLGARWLTRRRVFGSAAVVFLIGIVAAVLVLARGDESPPPDPAAVHGQLDCTPGVVAIERIPDDDRTPKQRMQAAEPGVVSVIQDRPSPPRWWGYDADGVIVAGLESSGTPGDFWIYSCTG